MSKEEILDKLLKKLILAKLESQEKLTDAHSNDINFCNNTVKDIESH